MARFNKRPSGLLTPVALIQSNPVATGRTAKGAPGFERDAKSELFLLAVANFVGQKTFHEDATKRDQRYASLIHTVAREDPQWLARFLPWLRSEANMRTAAIVGAVEFAFAHKSASSELPGLTRATMTAVLQRADEPGEALAYCMNVKGRKVPKAVKRGIADAAQRLFNERNALKYDTASHAFRFGDVLELCHVKPGALYQTKLFPYLVSDRHGRAGHEIEQLRMLWANAILRKEAERNPQVLLDPETLRNAGMTWEDVLSLAGSKVDKKLLWEALIPTMGYMALLRNLRNFDEAGVSDEMAQRVAAKLTDPDEIARSRQLPLRFLSAYREAPSLRWSYPLVQALNLSLQNVPSFAGRTLILVDTSGSMNAPLSDRSKLMRWDAAVLFGVALAQRCENADVFSFSHMLGQFPLRSGESLLASLNRWQSSGLFFDGGTATQSAVSSTYRNHDRVVILTDEQADYHGYRDVTVSVPQDKLVVTFNLAGYRMGHAPSGTRNRVTIGGLTDSAFKLMPMLEAHSRGQWPF